MKDTFSILSTSPFFENLSPDHLHVLATEAEWRTVGEGTCIFKEGATATAFYILVVGAVELSFSQDDLEGRLDSADESSLGWPIPLTKIDEPGRPIGWSCMVEPYQYRANAVAAQDCQLLCWERRFLQAYCKVHPDCGVAFMQRILWALGNRLRATRIRLIARRYETEAFAIRALLDQNAEELTVDSPLHKIPYYLGNRLTVADAFHTLELLRAHGDATERNVASLCLEILENVHAEMRLFQHQQTIYESVAHAAPDAAPDEIRTRCCQAFITLFKNVRHVIQGMENLPTSSGHIVILNHLVNHPDNILPNDFQLTLDTHFVSAMMLYEKYGHAPIRVIRKSRPEEYGHQMYYDRLGYIYVYSGHVDEFEDDPKRLAEERRLNFLDVAAGYLKEGRNIVICPEGTSTTTELSPCPFKAGAFRLASFVQPEPLIIPIAVANFDKK